MGELLKAVANPADRGVSTCEEPSDLATESTVTESSEVALVRRAQRGDADAFGELVRQYQRRAASLAFRLVSNSSDAADVTQDAFVRAYRSLGQLEDPARFGGWLLRIVGNLSLNFRRARASRPAGSLDDAMEGGADFRRPTTGQSLRIERDTGEGPLPTELHGAVSRALETLPDKQRLALILFSVEGLPQKEVADILDCSVELVKWNVFQARQKLKDLLAEHL